MPEENQETTQPPSPTPTENPVVATPAPESVPEPTPAPPPVTFAPQPAAATVPTAPEHSSPGIIVLQWLTYAFWGWTVLTMSVLTASVLSNFISDTDNGDFVLYAVAAVLVLLPISLVCEFFYGKHEPAKKTGAASIVMVIHAVIFGLFGIGSVIAIVFSIVTLFTSLSDTSGSQVALYSSIIITFLYAAVFTRTLLPARLPWIRRAFVMTMVVVVGIIAILGLVGPTAKARETRIDRLIEDNISSLERGIEDYAQEHEALPGSLGAVQLASYDEDAKKLITDKLVQYTPNLKQPTTEISKYDEYGTLSNDTSTVTTYYYELCVTYKKASKDDYSSSYNNKSEDGYSTSADAYSHPAGKVCYKLKTTPYEL